MYNKTPKRLGIDLVKAVGQAPEHCQHQESQCFQVSYLTTIGYTSKAKANPHSNLIQQALQMSEKNHLFGKVNMEGRNTTNSQSQIAKYT